MSVLFQVCCPKLFVDLYLLSLHPTVNVPLGHVYILMPKFFMPGTLHAVSQALPVSAYEAQTRFLIANTKITGRNHH